MTVQAFILLCALTTLASAGAAARIAHLGWIAAGFVAGLVLLLPALLGLPFAPLLAVEPTQVALLLVLYALARLRGGIGLRTGFVIGGVLAVVWAQALRATGWPLFAALPFVAIVTALAAWLGVKKEEFVTAQLQDDVSIVVLAGGLLVALVPDIVAGWNSAQVMQGGAGAVDAAAATREIWIAAGFVVLGAVFAWWKSNRRWSR